MIVRRPTLTILCGLPGSGKSTYAKGLLVDNPNMVWLSSDNIREELFGDAAIQAEPNKVFSLMQQRAIAALNNYKSVIYDATNLTRKARAGILNVCPKFVTVNCVVVWAPIDKCIELDLARERTVGKDVIMRMATSFQFPYYDEGIDDIFIHYSQSIAIDYYSNVLNAQNIPHDNPHHQYDILKHCSAAEIWAIENKYPTVVKQAAFYHDFGKPYVKSFTDAKGNATDIAHYYGHPGVGAWVICGITNNIDVIWLVSVHMEPFSNSKYWQHLPEYLKQLVDQVHDCDLHAH